MFRLLLFVIHLNYLWRGLQVLQMVAKPGRVLLLDLIIGGGPASGRSFRAASAKELSFHHIWRPP